MFFLHAVLLQNSIVTWYNVHKLPMGIIPTHQQESETCKLKHIVYIQTHILTMFT